MRLTPTSVRHVNLLWLYWQDTNPYWRNDPPLLPIYKIKLNWGWGWGGSSWIESWANILEDRIHSPLSTKRNHHPTPVFCGETVGPSWVLKAVCVGVVRTAKAEQVCFRSQASSHCTRAFHANSSPLRMWQKVNNSEKPILSRDVTLLHRKWTTWKSQF